MDSPPRRRSADDRDRGAAVVDFVLVGTLVIALFLCLLQLGIDLYLRNVLAACAADGARYGANADLPPAAAVTETANLISSSAGSSFATGVQLATDPADTTVDGASVVTVVVRARLPVIFGLLPVIPIVVEGQALREPYPVAPG